MASKNKRVQLKRARAINKRGAAYTYKLATLRKFVGGFDAKKFDALKFSKPRTDAGKKAKRAALSKVSRTFSRFKRFVDTPHKVVRPKNKKQLEALRQFVGVGNFKNLRAVPFATTAKKLRVRFDKHNRPVVSEDGVRNTLYLFPHIPRFHKTKVTEVPGVYKYLDAQDDAIEMTRAMLPEMRDGYYIFLTRHNFLISHIVARDRLEDEVRALYSAYAADPEFLKLFSGFRYLTDSEETYMEVKRELTEARFHRKQVKKRARLAKAYKEIVEMDRQLKSGQPLTRGQTTRREKLAKLSKRARATGRQ